MNQERLQDVFQRIDAFAKLKDNWDSYGAKPITQETIAEARRAEKIFMSEAGWSL